MFNITIDCDREQQFKGEGAKSVQTIVVPYTSTAHISQHVDRTNRHVYRFYVQELAGFIPFAWKPYEIFLREIEWAKRSVSDSQVRFGQMVHSGHSRRSILIELFYRFIQVIQLAGKPLKSAFYNLVTYVEVSSSNHLI